MKIYDAITKSVISIEEIVVEASIESGISRGNCFDLFGFDVLIDSNLKPWVLEINLSPSLATDSPLDLHIKGHLVSDTFNLVGIRAFDRKKESINKTKARLRAKRSLSGRPGPTKTHQVPLKSSEAGLAVRFRDIARDSAEEFLRRGHFLRIFPARGCECYDAFFSTPRNANKYIARTLLSEPDIVLKDPEAVFQFYSRPQTSLQACASERRIDNLDTQQKTFDSRPGSVAYVRRGLSASAPRKSQFSDEELTLEFTSRLAGLLGKVNERDLQTLWKRTLENFIGNSVWNGSDLPRESLAKRLENRYHEMRDKKRGGKSSKQVSTQLSLASYSNQHLEDFLRKLPIGHLRDLFQPFVRRHSGGLLSDLSHPQQRSHTLSQLHSLPHASDEEESLPPDTRKRSLEHMPSVSTLRPIFKASVRPSTRKILKTLRK